MTLSLPHDQTFIGFFRRSEFLDEISYRIHRFKLKKVLKQRIRYKFNMIVRAINCAANKNNGTTIAYCEVRYSSVFPIKREGNVYIYETYSRPVHVQHHAWRFIYSLLKPNVYLYNPSKKKYPVQVKHDYLSAHLENVKANFPNQWAYIVHMDVQYPWLKSAEIVPLFNRLIRTASCGNMSIKNYGCNNGPINYHKWLTNWDIHDSRGRSSYYQAFVNEFSETENREIVLPHLEILKSNLSADYFTVSKQLEKAELASMKRVRLSKSGALRKIPSRVSMLMAQFA